MKVVILMPMATQRGGGELMLWQLLERARDDGIEWVVIFFEDGPLVPAFRDLGITCYVVSTGRLRNGFQYIQSVVQIANIIRSESADLVFSWSGKPHLYGSIAAKLNGVPAAWYQLGCPVGRHLSWMDRIATALPAKCIFALSKFGAKGQKELWPHRRIELVYPSVNLNKFDPESLPSAQEARKMLGLPSDGPIIGIVGRLQRWKGIHVFVDAMARVKTSHPNVHGVIVGGKHDLEPEYTDFVKRRIDELDLGDTITLAGFQSNVPHWMQAMDVFVHASDNEPFGIVVIEAMALGKPIVAGDSGGPQEIITEGVDGLLAPYEEAGTLAQRIRRYLDDPDFADSVGRAARNRALDFSPKRYAARFVQAIRNVVPSAHTSTTSLLSAKA